MSLFLWLLVFGLRCEEGSAGNYVDKTYKASSGKNPYCYKIDGSPVVKGAINADNLESLGLTTSGDGCNKLSENTKTKAYFDKLSSSYEKVCICNDDDLCNGGSTKSFMFGLILFVPFIFLF